MGPPVKNEGLDEQGFVVLSSKAKAKIPGEEKLIIALDFGTSYSGVAYAFTTQPDEIHAVTEWPGADGKTMLKCPTLVEYKEAGNIAWGYEVDRLSDGCIDSVKLLLDPSQPKPLYMPPENMGAKLEQLGKLAIDVATDYIKAIMKHAYNKIESKYPKDYLSMVKKQYVLSVPAVWTDKAKDATMQAARNAEVDSIKLIKEPEAAALYTLHHMGNKGLNPGDALVLSDAGGGTVDLISYEVIKLSPFELKELTDCTGSLAGSLVLNKRFEAWIRDVVGDEEYSRLCKTDAYRRAMRTFNDDIKPEFRPQNNRTEYVSFPTAKLPSRPEKGLLNDILTVGGTKLHEIFEPIFHEIDRLIKEQVTAVQLRRLKDQHPKGTEIRAILLVGGFGSSAYLKDATAAAHPNIQVIQPNDAQAAIVRGAVMSQLPMEAKVVINHAPKHYGVAAASVVDEILDAGHNGYWDTTTGEWRIKTMFWHIHKGDDLHRARKIELPFVRNFTNYPQPHELYFSEELMECVTDNAPRYPKPGVTRTNVKLYTNLSGAPKSHIRKKTKTVNGVVLKWWSVDYKLVVTIDSGPLKFSCICSGIEAGEVTTQY